MADLAPQFETRDRTGSTTTFANTVVGTTLVLLPTVASNSISSVVVRNLGSREVKITIDNGVTFIRVQKRSEISLDIRNNIQQIGLITDIGLTLVEGFIHLEDSTAS